MKITKRQLRRIIKETFLHEGYSIPEFSNSASMQDWVDELIDEDPDAEVENDVIDPETGETVIPGGESPREQQWWQERDDYDPYADSEGVAKMNSDEPEGEFDWDAYAAEDEARLEKQREDDNRIQDMLTADAAAGGEDWAGDTLYDAKNNPSMWQGQHASAEDYVMSFGQDAAGDIADSLLRWSSEPEVAAWYKSLPDKAQRQGGRYRENRITKTIMREILADYFYDGVAKAIEKKRAA
jgi:heme-degrading monooxygenase HmoA